MMEVKAEYEDATGKSFYIIADSLVYTIDDLEAADYVLYYNALTGADMTAEEVVEFVK